MADESAEELAILAVGEGSWGDVVAEALLPFGFPVVAAPDLDAAFAAVHERRFPLCIVAPAVAGGDGAARLSAALEDALVVVVAGAGAGACVTRTAQQVREAARGCLVRLANHLAHDLNNPLGGLKLYVRLLERALGAGKTAEASDLAGKIGRAVDQLTEILSEIRSYDRLPASERTGTRLETALEDCLRPGASRGGGV